MAVVWRRGATEPPSLGGSAYSANYGEQVTDIADKFLNGPYKPSDNMRFSRMATEWVIGGGSTKQRMKHPVIHYKFGDDEAVVFEDCFSDSSNEASTQKRSRSVPHAKLICSTTMTDLSDSDEDEVWLHGTQTKRMEVVRETTSDQRRNTERTQGRGKADMPCAGFNKLSL